MRSSLHTNLPGTKRKQNGAKAVKRLLEAAELHLKALEPERVFPESHRTSINSCCSPLHMFALYVLVLRLEDA